MITISLCMIVKNEEDVLARCLDCAINFADEIIIVDTGSTDRTKEIAALYTEQVYDFEWIDDFAAARNFAFSKATMEYCMWLDADDIIRFEDQKKLVDLKNTLPPDTDMVMMISLFATRRSTPQTQTEISTFLKNCAGAAIPWICASSSITAASSTGTGAMKKLNKPSYRS